MYRGATDSNIKIVTSGLLLYLDAAQLRSYPGSGTTWTDLSGNNRNGALTNGPTFSNTNGGTIVFDGTNDCVNINSNELFLTYTAYTKIAWFYTTNFSATNNILSGGVRQHAFWLAGSNKLYGGHSSPFTTIGTTTTLSLNTWYCGAVTFNSTTGWVIYLNGVQENTSSDTLTFGANGDINVGSFTVGNYVFQGNIANAFVYKIGRAHV